MEDKMSRKEAEELFDNNFDCYTYEEGLSPEEDLEQPAVSREKFIELAESHIGNVMGSLLDAEIEKVKTSPMTDQEKELSIKVINAIRQAISYREIHVL
jgi:hypothetical protein